MSSKKYEIMFKTIVESNIENHFESAIPNILIVKELEHFKDLQERYKDIIEENSIEKEVVSLYDLDLVSFDSKKHTILFIEDIDNAIEFDNYNLDIIRSLILFGRIEKRDQLEVVDLTANQVTPLLYVKDIDRLLLTKPEEYLNIWVAEN